MDLASLLPQKRIVCLAGEYFSARQFRLREVAALEQFVRDAVGNPLDPVRHLISAAEGEAREALLRSVGKACADYPPKHGSPEHVAVAYSVQGVAFQLGLLLREHVPVLPPEKLLDIATKVTVPEWLNAVRVGWGADLDPSWELVNLINPPEEPGGEKPPQEWGKTLAHFAEVYSYTPEQFADLHINQYAAMLARGDLKPPSPKPRPGETLAELGLRLARLTGELPDDTTNGGGDG